MEDGFAGQLDRAWKIHTSGRHARSSFTNEGKSGEIYAVPDTSVYAERAWPKETASVELTCSPDDLLSQGVVIHID